MQKEKNTLKPSTKVEDSPEVKESVAGPVTREEYNKLMEEVGKMRKGIMPVYDDDDKPDNKMCYVSLYQNNPVVGLKQKFKEVRNEVGEMVTIITLEVQNGDKVEEVEVSYLNYVKGIGIEKVPAEVIKEDVKMKKEIHGYTTRKYVKDYRTVDTRVKVPCKVEYPEVYYTVKLADGRTFKIDIKYLN